MADHPVISDSSFPNAPSSEPKMPIDLTEQNEEKPVAVHLGGKPGKSDDPHFVSGSESLAIVGEKKWQAERTTFSHPSAPKLTPGWLKF